MELIELYKQRDKLAKAGKDTGEVTEIIESEYKVKEKKPIILTKSYYANPELYPKYDNYDAINVDRCEDIPYDYDGIMGVPITFLSMRDRIYIPVDDTSLNTISTSMPKCNEIQKICINYLCSQFEIIDARTIALNDKQKNKTTALIKDADSAINGKPTYARICIKRVS